MDRVTDWQYLEKLPVDSEPSYAEGFYCDACSKEFMEGPLYHSAATGRDCCMYCAQMKGMHSITGLVCELFTPSSPDLMLYSALASVGDSVVVPLFCYMPEHTTTQIGLYLSDGSSLLMNVTNFVIERGTYRSIEGTKVTLDGDALVERFPWLPLWCDPRKLTSSVRPTFRHAALGVRREYSLPSDLEIMVDAVDQSKEDLLYFYFTNGLTQIFDSSQQIEIVAFKGAMVRCRFRNQFLSLKQQTSLHDSIKSRIAEICRSVVY